MLGPKGGFRLPSVQGKLPASRSIYAYVLRARFLASVALVTCIIIFWRSISTSAADMQKFYCFGPSKSPMEMTPNDASDWSGFDTPVIFNHHAPLEINSSTIVNFDLNPIKSTPNGVENKERVLILTPLRDATKHLEKYFELLVKLTYPHDLIDLGFLVGDSSDSTLAKLSAEVDRVQRKLDKTPFRSVKIVQKDFGGVQYSQDVEERHSFAAQGPRRKAMGRARNYLLYSTLRPDHSWVYWRDVDIVDSPPPIIQDMILHDRDIIVPNIWFHRYDDQNRDIEGRFDYNSWQESPEGLELAASLPKDTVLAEGYSQYETHRKHMAKMGHWTEDKDVEIELDGIGGVNVMVKADVHRSGINFPCYAFENQAETEGFAKMAKRAGYQVIGLPNYIVWHIDTEEKPGNG